MHKTMICLLIGLIQMQVFSQSTGTAINISDDVALIKLSNSVYIQVSYFNTSNYGRVGANGLIIINEDKAFLFDTPWTEKQTETLYSWMTDSMNLKLIGFMPNHWHNDCMGGLGYLQMQNVPSYANHMTIDIAKSKDLPIPENGFRDTLRLKLGNTVIECYYLGGAHSTDNIVVWIPSEQILFPGCMVKSMASSTLGNTSDGDLIAYPKTLNRLSILFPNAKIVIPGHGRYGGMELIEHTLELFRN